MLNAASTHKLNLVQPLQQFIKQKRLLEFPMLTKINSLKSRWTLSNKKLAIFFTFSGTRTIPTKKIQTNILISLNISLKTWQNTMDTESLTTVGNRRFANKNKITATK
jgi:hypothetical protein